MDAARFDRLTKLLSETGTRRRALQGLLSAALAAVPGTHHHERVAAQTCKGVGKRCNTNDDCCSAFCEPRSRQCVATCAQGEGVCDALAPCAPGCSCYRVELGTPDARACLHDPPAGTSLPTKACPDTLLCAPHVKHQGFCLCEGPQDCPKGYLCTASSCCRTDTVCLPLCEPEGS